VIKQQSSHTTKNINNDIVQCSWYHFTYPARRHDVKGYCTTMFISEDKKLNKIYQSFFTTGEAIKIATGTFLNVKGEYWLFRHGTSFKAPYELIFDKQHKSQNAGK